MTVAIVSLVPGGLLGSSACEDDIGTDWDVDAAVDGVKTTDNFEDSSEDNVKTAVIRCGEVGEGVNCDEAADRSVPHLKRSIVVKRKYIFCFHNSPLP